MRSRQLFIKQSSLFFSYLVWLANLTLNSILCKVNSEAAQNWFHLYLSSGVQFLFFLKEACFVFFSLFILIAVCPIPFFNISMYLAKTLEPNALSFLPLPSRIWVCYSGVSYKRKEQWEADALPSCTSHA